MPRFDEARRLALIQDLVRQFRGQFHKRGLIIDERFNSGGQIPDRFVELLGRRVLNYWGVRDGKATNSSPRSSGRNSG